MRKTVFIGVLILVVALAIGTVAQEGNNGWMKFADDRYQVVGEVDGETVLVRVDSQEDLAKVALAKEHGQINEKVNGRHKALPPVAMKALNCLNDQTDLTSSAMSFNYEVTLPKDLEPQHQVHVRELVHNGKKMMIAELESGSKPLIADPAKKNYVFSDENLWLVNAETKEVKQLTKDQVGRFNRLEIVPAMQQKNEDYFVHWAHQPKWNANGTLVSFETNRDMLDTTAGMSLWTVDPVTGEEQHVFSANGGFQTLGWINADEVVYEECVLPARQWTVKVANVRTGESRTIAQNVRFLGMNSEYVVYGQETGGPLYEVFVADVTGTEVQSIAQTRNNFMFDHFANISPDGTRVVLKSRNMQGKQLITLVNLVTMDTRELQGPWGHMVSADPVWLDDNRIMIQTEGENQANAQRTATWIYQF